MSAIKATALFRTSVMAHQYWGPYHLGGGKPTSWVMSLMEKCGLWGTTARKIGSLTDRAFPCRRRGADMGEEANHD
jgi:hypothetical protein